MEITYQDYLQSIGESNEVRDSGIKRILFTRDVCEGTFFLNTESGEPWMWRDHSGYSAVDFELCESEILNTIADDIVEADGQLPFFRDNVDGEYDDAGWYDFFLRIFSNGKVELYFEIGYAINDTYRHYYDIKLTEEEQKTILEYMIPFIESEDEGYGCENINMRSFLAGGPLYGKESD